MYVCMYVHVCMYVWHGALDNREIDIARRNRLLRNSLAMAVSHVQIVDL